MSGFEESTVRVEQVDDTNWKLLEGFDYQGKSEVFHVPPGQPTDFASVPRLFVWFLPRYGRWTKAAILHDHLWRDRAGQGKMEYVDADGTFRRAMRELEVPFLKRWIMWGAVRWGALLKPGGRKGWLREFPRLALITAVALPIVLPPALVVAAALLLFFLVECAVWVPLKAAEVLKRRTEGATPKQAVAPHLSWKL
ncbi:MAG TPA: DUF1353 domain-containing protein [Acidimicrobiales bacterium]|nr:DUF1353 domain-containing protein [Acidimicrobiales bacterium]